MRRTAIKFTSHKIQKDGEKYSRDAIDILTDEKLTLVTSKKSKFYDTMINSFNHQIHCVMFDNEKFNNVRKLTEKETQNMKSEFPEYF